MIQEQSFAGRAAFSSPDGARTPSTRLPGSDLGFGRYFTDHLVVAEFEPSHGWRDARVVPRTSLALDPAASALQYGQSVFEGLKAYRDPRGGAHRLFRVDRHAVRFKASARRVCLPEVPESLFVEAVRSVIRADADWMPSAEGTAFYLRPTLLGTEAFLGVRPSATAMFYVLLSPVGSYWQGGRRALRIWVEDSYVRAALGGLGAAKTGANYAASLLAAEVAKSRGFDQVLWLDAERRARVEEIGTMNLFVRIGDTVVTPSIDGTILDGVTRACVLDLLRDWGIPTEERPLDLAEIAAAHANGTLREMFGTGTAAVIAPLGVLGSKSGELIIGDGHEGELTRRLFDEIRAIQSGAAEDRYGWLTPV